MVRLKKELRAARLPWVCSLVAVAYIPVHHLVFFAAGEEAPFLTTLAYFIAAVSLALALAQVFGSEFQTGTLNFLLAQPTSRTKLWWQKFAAQLIIGGSVFAVYGTVLLAGWGGETWRSDALQPDHIGYAALIIMVIVSSICLWTTIGRSSIAGATLSWFAICMGGLLCKVLFNLLQLRTAQANSPDLDLRIQALDRWWPVIVATAAVGYSASTIYLGWRRFIGFGLAPGAEGTGAPAGRGGASLLPGWLRPEPNRNFRNLLRKEFCLQKPVMKLAFLYLICWLAGFGLSKLPARGSEHFMDFCDLLTVFYCPVAVILAAALSVTEEKTLGIYEWQLTLPVSAGRQWLTRMGVSASTGFVLGYLLPAGLVVALRTKETDGGSFVVFAGVAIAAWTWTFWAATFTTSTVRAALGGLLSMFGGVLCLVGAITFANWQVVDPVSRLSVSKNHSGELGLAFVAFSVGVGYFLQQSRQMMKRPRPRPLTIGMSACGGALLIFLVSWGLLMFFQE